MSWMAVLVKKNENTLTSTKNTNLLKTKGILNIKMSAKGGPVFTFSLPGKAARSFAPVSYTTMYMSQLFTHCSPTISVWCWSRNNCFLCFFNYSLAFMYYFCKYFGHLVFPTYSVFVWTCAWFFPIIWFDAFLYLGFSGSFWVVQYC